MLLRRDIVMAAILLAGFLGYIISRLSGADPAKIMQVLLFVFVGLLIAGFVWQKYRCK